MRQFGEPPPDEALVTERPGAYAVLVDARWRVAVVTVGSSGGWLPGGGLEGDETPEAALHRELLEETGWTVELLHPMGPLGQYLWHEGRWYNKICHVWVCRPIAQTDALEADHTVHWLGPTGARAQLVHEAHRFAVHQAFKPC
jgi:8-oxo-dGTP diphosphatase